MNVRRPRRQSPARCGVAALATKLLAHAISEACFEEQAEAVSIRGRIHRRTPPLARVMGFVRCPLFRRVVPPRERIHVAEEQLVCDRRLLAGIIIAAFGESAQQVVRLDTALSLRHVIQVRHCHADGHAVENGAGREQATYNPMLTLRLVEDDGAPVEEVAFALGKRRRSKYGISIHTASSVPEELHVLEAQS